MWLPGCVLADKHFTVHFQDLSSSSSGSMRKFVHVFGVIFLAVERASANRRGFGGSLLPGWFGLSGRFSLTRFLEGKDSDFGET